MMNPIIYFSSQSENTHRFVGRLGVPAMRIPLQAEAPMPDIASPYILVVPSYGGGSTHGAVPR